MRFGARLGLTGMILLAVSPAQGLTLEELMADGELTPARFAAAFADFAYEYQPEVLDAEAFLSGERGDCDDYAVLADYVLGRHGYGTRLVHVRMVGRVAHAVCYVVENRAYLDYNNRIYFFKLERSDPGLREIAAKVARSFEANWTSVSEFTYDYATHEKTIGITVVKTDPPESDPDR